MFISCELVITLNGLSSDLIEADFWFDMMSLWLATMQNPIQDIH
jgi:hypothetical protein